MLSQNAKDVLRKTIVEFGDPDLLRENGPRKIIDWLATHAAREGAIRSTAAKAVTANVLENQAEAERFIAGLLGLA